MLANKLWWFGGLKYRELLRPMLLTRQPPGHGVGGRIVVRPRLTARQYYPESCMAGSSEGAPASCPADDTARNPGSNTRDSRDSYVGNHSARSVPGSGLSNGDSRSEDNREKSEANDPVSNGPDCVENNGQDGPGCNLGDNGGDDPGPSSGHR